METNEPKYWKKILDSRDIKIELMKKALEEAKNKKAKPNFLGAVQPDTYEAMKKAQGRKELAKEDE